MCVWSISTSTLTAAQRRRLRPPSDKTNPCRLAHAEPVRTVSIADDADVEHLSTTVSPRRRRTDSGEVRKVKVEGSHGLDAAVETAERESKIDDGF